MNKTNTNRVSGSRGFWSGVLAATMLIAVITNLLAEVPRPEHPRPDAFRDNWITLNGEWQFEIDQNGDGEARGLVAGKELSSKILVPFCPESKLSGLGLATNYLPHVWYRRHFQVPAAMGGQRLRLHFGAVDYAARVWLNGQFLGEHSGG
jgi:beta-galactosidase/beta-glucuronidase